MDGHVQLQRSGEQILDNAALPLELLPHPAAKPQVLPHILMGNTTGSTALHKPKGFSIPRGAVKSP